MQLLLKQSGMDLRADHLSSDHHDYHRWSDLSSHRDVHSLPGYSPHLWESTHSTFDLYAYRSIRNAEPCSKPCTLCFTRSKPSPIPCPRLLLGGSPMRNRWTRPLDDAFTCTVWSSEFYTAHESYGGLLLEWLVPDWKSCLVQTRLHQRHARR